MKKILSLTISLIVAGCASPPVPKVPSPYGREPVNSAQAINAYREQSTEETALRHERTELQRHVDALQQQVAEMKAFIIMQAAEKSADAETTKRSPPQDSGHRPKLSQVDRSNDDVKPVSVEIRTDAVVFRFFNNYASTQFEPSARLIEPLLSAAKEGHQIVVRGRTD